MFKKILGAGLGWTFGGPIGAIVGWWLAGKLDNTEQKALRQAGATASTESDFIVALLILCSQVMKADGKVLRSEVHFVREFLTKSFSAAQAEEMMEALRTFQERDFQIDEVAVQIREHMPLGERTQLLYLMFGIALADGELHTHELTLIEKISHALGISTSVFQSTKAMFSRGNTLQDAYTILGVHSTASPEEIKLAYRNLAKEHHPDKVSHLGQELRKSAEEKFKKISSAYDAIKKSRSF